MPDVSDTVVPTLRALRLIAAAQSADPKLTDGRPAELVYAERIADTVAQLNPAPSLALRLAAACQHLERWAIPRTDYPQDKPGYFAWRKAVHARQGARARALLTEAGIDAATAARVDDLIAKRLPRDPDGQTLEDAACLVFFTHDVHAFAAAKRNDPAYTPGKYIDIIRKTWRKMSPAAQAIARTIPYPPPLDDLVRAALTLDAQS